MADFRQLRNLRYGDLNDLKENDDNVTGDRRRTSPLTALRMATEKAFQKSTLKSIDEFHGVIVGRRNITYATAAYPSTLLSPTSAEDEDSTYGNWLYRIYIPELEPLPPPTGSGDPVLLGYQEIPVDSVAVPRSGPLGLGQVVQVRYDDPELLNNPKIVKVVTDRRPVWGASGPVVETPSTNPNPNPTRRHSRTSTTTVPPPPSTPSGTPPTAPAAPVPTSAAGEPCDNPDGYPDPPAWVSGSPPEAWAKRDLPVKNCKAKRLPWDEMEVLIPPLQELLTWIAAHEGKANSVNRTKGGDTPGKNGVWIDSGPLEGRNFETMTVEQVLSLMMGFKNNAGAWEQPGTNAKYVKMQDKSSLADSVIAPPLSIQSWLDSGRLAQQNGALKNNGFYTAGLYQLIPVTFWGAVKGYFTPQRAGILAKDFDVTGQDKFGVSLLFRKRRAVGGYLCGLHDNVGYAAWWLAAEWASIGIPFRRRKNYGTRRAWPVLEEETAPEGKWLIEAGRSYYPGSANTTGYTGHTPCQSVYYLKRARWNLLNNAAAVAMLEAAGFRTSDEFLNSASDEEE